MQVLLGEKTVSLTRYTVTHSREIVYVYGQEAVESTNPAVRQLSMAMMDYWLSYVVSMTPNDGKGVSSEYPRL